MYIRSYLFYHHAYQALLSKEADLKREGKCCDGAMKRAESYHGE